MKHFKVGDYVNVGAHVREVSEDKKKVVVEVDGAYMRLSAALVWNPDAESAEPSKPTAQESMNAEQFWKHKFPNMVDEAGVCEFAEAYASERVAQADSWRRVAERLEQEKQELAKQVEGLRAALRGLMYLTDQAREGGMILSRYDGKPITNGDQDIIDQAYIQAEAALATQLPTKH